MADNTDLKVLIIGATSLARKAISLVEKIDVVTGVVNLHPDLGFKKSNYDFLTEFSIRRSKDVYLTRDINDKETLDWIAVRKPDLIIQCGWSQIFKTTLLNIPRHFCIGIHPAPLPKGRGAAILNWKIIEGGGEWGSSLFVMTEKTDTGDILDFEPFVIGSKDDIYTAFFKADRAALKMLKRTLPKIANNTFTRIPQDDSKATRYFKRRPEDGLIDTRWDSKKNLRYIRALTRPYPGAFFQTVYGQLIVWQAESGVKEKQAKPGTILAIEPGQGVLLKVGADESIWITLIASSDSVDCQADRWALEKKIKVGDLIIKKFVSF